MERKSDACRPPRTVLIFRFSALGDVCMTIPVVYGVCRANPDTQFVYVTKPPVTALFIDPPANLAVAGADLKRDYRGWRGVIRLFRELCDKYHPDAVADLHSVLRTYLIDVVARMRGLRVVRLDKMRRQRQELTGRGATHAPALPPMVSRYAEVFARLGLRAEPLEEAPVFGSLSSDTSADVLPSKTAGMTWIGVAPFAAHRGKVYPVDRMYEVVKMLAARPDTRIILFGGGPRETEILDAWAAGLAPAVVSLAGKKCVFARELAVMGQCDVMLTMDSANMHLASLMGTRVISVWGATHPAAGFGGWLQSQYDAVQAPLPCRPCSVFGNKICHRGDYACLSAVTPAEIVDKVISALV